MLNFELDIDITDLGKFYCVYILRNKNDELYHIGHCKLTEVFMMPDARRIKAFNRTAKYKMSVFSYKTKEEAMVLYYDIVKRSGLPILTRERTQQKKQVLLCEQTGQLFSGQNTASKETGAHQSAISSVLLGKLKQTNGYTFRYIDCDDGNIHANLRLGNKMYLSDMKTKPAPIIPSPTRPAAIPYNK